MKLLCRNLRRTVAKGPYIFIAQGKTIMLKQGEAQEVDDVIAFKILERDGDIIEIIKEEAKPPTVKAKPGIRKKAKPAQNKMAKAPVDK